MKPAVILGLILLWGHTAGGVVWGGSADVIEQIGEGSVNWSQGVLTAKGSGAAPRQAKNIAQARLMAEQEALAEARHNLEEALKALPVEGESSVEGYMAKDDDIRLQTESVSQGATEVKNLRRFLPDGRIEITLAATLRGDLLDLLLNASPWAEPQPSEPAAEDLEARNTEEPKGGEEESSGLEKIEKPREPAAEAALPPVNAAAEPKASPPVDLPPYTGLVVDGRGVSAKAALLPRIVDERGRDLYCGPYVSREKAAQNGVALYTRDLKAAQRNPRVGKNPLTVKARGVNPAAPSEIILSGEEAQKVSPFARQGTFLEECKVIIVLD